MSKHKRRRVQVKANELSDVDVSYISLVNRPANQIPFRILKADTIENSEEPKDMINLNTILRKQKVQSPKIVAVVVSKEDAEKAKPQLENLGLTTDNMQEKEDTVVYTQCTYKTEDAIPVAIKEGLVALVTGMTQKFTSFVDSMNFDENLKAASFIPGLHMGSEAFFDTVRTILFKEDIEGEDVKASIKVALDQYANFVMGLVDEIPEAALKMDSINLEKVKEKKEIKEDSVNDKSATKSESKKEPVDKPKKDTGNESIAKKKEETKKEDSTSEPDDAGPGSTNDVVKKEEENTDLVKLITTMKDQMSKSLKGINDELKDVKTSNTDLCEKLKEVEKLAKAADKAIKGTMIQDTDAFSYDESLGIKGHKEKDSKNVDDFWGGVLEGLV